MWQLHNEKLNNFLYSQPYCKGKMGEAFNRYMKNIACTPERKIILGTQTSRRKDNIQRDLWTGYIGLRHFFETEMTISISYV
jgi:hypothetical protein